jgi:hypothetical protein
MAEIYDKAGERLLIPAVREAYIQPFDAPNWLDLRAGFFLSITDKTNDDLITGLAETINLGVRLFPADRYWIGFKTNEIAWPRTENVVFIGYSNTMVGPVGVQSGETLGNSVLASSDAGIGAGSNYYWPNNSHNPSWSVIITDGQPIRRQSLTGAQQHFAQVVGGAGAAGYATLLALRLTRPNVQSKLVTISFKSVPAFSSDILFSSTPTKEIIETNLLDFPTSVQTRGPTQLRRVPDALYFYWPFRNSRLRIHSIGVLKYR